MRGGVKGSPQFGNSCTVLEHRQAGLKMRLLKAFISFDIRFR